ncbi:hypothetical protein Tco_0993296 [Tanacetum coccineum]|uniref:Zinc finger, CCHC-type n=1 Tax=Tanacetum coccineum TaxID=301880 RepID=A0ABQ5F6A0_9ASTR
MQLTLVAYLLPHLFTPWSDLRNIVGDDYLRIAPEALAAHTAWVKGSKEIVGLMLMTMEPDIQLYLENLSAYEMLQELKTLLAQQAEQELLQTMGKTVNELHAMLKLHEQTLPKKDPASGIRRQKSKKNNKQKKPVVLGTNIKGRGQIKLAYAPTQDSPSTKEGNPAQGLNLSSWRDKGHWIEDLVIHVFSRVVKNIEAISQS